MNIRVRGAGWRRHGARALSLMLCLMAGGCALVGPNYQVPVTDSAPAFAEAATAQAQAIDIAWWEGFADAELSRLIQEAQAANLDLRVALANLRAARALLRQTDYDRQPTVQAQAGYAIERASSATPAGRSTDRDLDLLSLGFDASWELDFFGRVRRGIEAQSAEVGAAEAGIRDVIVSVFAEVARNYLELRGTQAQLEVAMRNSDNQRRTLALTQELLQSGAGTELDTARAEAQLANTLASMPSLEAGIRRSAHRLAVLTGAQPQVLRERLLVSAALPALPAALAIGDPAALLRRRPDVQRAERRLAAATARVGVATADLFPRVTLLGSLGVSAKPFTGLVDDAETFSLGPSLRWAAFDLRRVRARIAAADAGVEGLLAEYEKTVLQSLEETENALSDFARERTRRERLRRSAAASAKAQGLAAQLFEEGYASFIDVLDAERTRLEAEDRLAASETATAVALVAVYKSLGGGWEALASATGSGMSREPGMQ